ISSTEEATRCIQELDGVVRFPFIRTPMVATAVIGAIVAALIVTHLITGGMGATPGVLLGVVALTRIVMVLQGPVWQTLLTRLKTVVVGTNRSATENQVQSSFHPRLFACIRSAFHIALLFCSTLSTFASMKSGKSRIAIARKVRHNNPARSDSAHMQPRECWQACGRLHKPS
ncbi:hypothetical protein F4604DRAFT_1718689, partial [Suillus subluteus]